ncbi:MAG: tRNA (adenosine(37)-N6)-dimethylallyltransferase MiaA, partial [Oscillospiraceae bacterium]|nr:tRNA (adenosine(37)-N6)-dimethylallyltransferase MiaA [Oscillospiraceae bacterium]
VDPESAQRLSPNDQKRIIRALEVYWETGKTITQHNRDSQRVPPRYDAVYLGFAFEDRQDMRDRIDARVEQMAEQGLLDEVRALLKRGVPRDSTALQAIGYKECLSFLDGQSTEEEALELIKLRSRQYAKRQLTWLRRNQDIHWFYWKKTRDFQAALAFSTEILRQRGVS